VADVLTKGLSRDAHERCVRGLGIQSPEVAFRRSVGPSGSGSVGSEGGEGKQGDGKRDDLAQTGFSLLTSEC
jgi:hypothetical protein